ncbi:hypothetical protein GCM10023196_079730 [Actinoallomurus vinaceus]|uniref:Uncharacterized protein n=1 Tax=Actinoallomurus vinaceus TaxID=1080074 RepID=A0ABP8UP56_9ACTN
MKDFPSWMHAFRDLPPSWTPPDELKKPTHSPARNLALAMLVSDLIGNDAIELIGEWISAGARLNIWFKNPERRNLGEGEYPELLQLQGKVAERVYASWCSYKSAIGEPSSESADPEYQGLIDAIRSGITMINDAMK